MVSACDLNPPEPQYSQPPPRVIGSPGALLPTPTSQPPAVWALWPLGVNVHAQPSTTAPVVTTALQGDELDVTGRRTVDGKTWLNVSEHSQNGVAGWVLDDPGLVIHQSVAFHVDTDQSWSMVFPSAWNVDEPNAPTGTTTLSGDGITLTIDVETPTPKFTAPGSDVNDQQIEVYGKTTILSTYRLPDGSYDLVARVKWDAQRYFTITYHEPAATNPDASLCLQLITGIKIT